MERFEDKAIWFVTGSQDLYGEETLRKVEENSLKIVLGLNSKKDVPCDIVFKNVLTSPESIKEFFEKAGNDKCCAGVIAWMHTFSPAKMWIAGLTISKKPLLHLHTQYNRDIPWDSIDMDFMNTNQAAHGDREFGFIGARMDITRKIVVGHWDDNRVMREISVWMRAACAKAEGSNLKIARFGDNMRQVAVTEGDKVEAQIKFGWSINGYGVGTLVEYVDSVKEQEIDEMLEEYHQTYDMSAVTDTDKIEAVRVQAGIEIGMEKFLKDGGYKAFTTSFEDLYGLKQLPGLAVQRLMAKGYGFGGEGDWKTAALVRIMKYMSKGMGKGTSFMEDYTYHLENGNETVLGAHMLEVCPTLADKKPSIQVHKLGIGGKADPARIVFEGKAGFALNASIIDLGTRFRLIVNVVDAVKGIYETPKLPVAKVLWKPQPSLPDAAKAWITAGGAHHTCFSYDITKDHLTDWADMSGIECVIIDNKTEYAAFRNELRWNSVYWSGR